MALGYIKNGQHYKVFGGSGGGSGHTIWNKIKTALTSRPALWFKDAKTTDDSTNDSTNVELMSTVTSTAFNALPTDGTADGFYVISDGTSEAIDASDVSYLNSSVKNALDSQSFVTATHSKTGTIHNITLPDSSITSFKFVATGDYATGDTFTVDGVTVTARVADGSTIPSGAFKINSTVECIIDGTILNLINVTGNINSAAVSYDNTSSGLTATNAQDAIDEVNSKTKWSAAITFSPNVYSSWNVYGNCYYKKKNDTVELNVSMINTAGAESTVITTLPVGYRPAHPIAFAAISLGTNVFGVGGVFVSDNGDVSITSPNSYLLANIKFDIA